MRQVVEARTFALADLALAFGSAGICYFWPQLGGWPLLLALLPWVGRAVTRRAPFQRTLLDLPLLLFLISAIAGLWAAYDQPSAEAKFWLIVGAFLIYYALAGQPEQNLWVVAGLLSVLSALVAVYFLLTADWRQFPADIDWITRLGVAWMSVRGSPLGDGLHPNVAGGLIAIFSPFSIALGIRGWRRRTTPLVILAICAAVLAFTGLLFSSSRAAWLALAVGLGVWLLHASIEYIITRSSWHWAFLALLLVSLVGLAAVWVAFTPAGPTSGVLDHIPGPNSAATRTEIFTYTLRLVRAFPFTGGGLAAFSGLYSQYIMVIPVFLFGYSHNLYLDIALEQGIFGLLSFLAVLVGSFWLVMRGARYPLLRGALLSGLVVTVFHGLVDDPLYGLGGTPLLLVLPGLAVALDRFEGATESIDEPLADKPRLWPRWLLIPGVLVAFLLFFLFQTTWMGAWYANLGAVELARVELADFPINQWDTGQDLAPYASSENLLLESLQRDPTNFVANYRLGLIAMLRRDFPSAKEYLERAYVADPEHRGLKKVLGYCYTWLGIYPEGALLLSQFPETKSELEAYAWFWREQGRNDLAARAEEMHHLIE